MDTVEGTTFLLRWGLAITALSLVFGTVYATGLIGDEQTTGLLLLVFSVGMVYICWQLARTRRRERDEQ